MNEENKAIAWDAEVNLAETKKEQQDFVVLPDGEYPFRVAKVERKNFNGSEKIPACGMMKIGMIFTAPDGRKSYVNENFYMVQKCLFKIYQFLVSIGVMNEDAPSGIIPWSKVDTSCEGRAKLTTCTWTNNNGETNTNNSVKFYLAPKSEENYDEDYD